MVDSGTGDVDFATGQSLLCPWANGDRAYYALWSNGDRAFFPHGLTVTESTPPMG